MRARMAKPQARVLIIAGSDSGGGAGVQADIKTVTMLGGYAATAITAITVQNTLGVLAVHALPAALIEAQARAVLTDIGADAIKTGLLGSAATVEAVAALLDDYPDILAVVDPVMVAKGGQDLLDSAGLEKLRALLLPRAALITPNAPEAAALTGLAVETLDDARRAAEALLTLGEGPRQDTRHTHGTGCSLASACALGLAEGRQLDLAVARAWAYVAEAIRSAPGLGAGHGPLGHAWPLRGK